MENIKLSQGVQFSIDFYYKGDITTIEDENSLLGFFDKSDIEIISLTRLGDDLSLALSNVNFITGGALLFSSNWNYISLGVA